MVISSSSFLFSSTPTSSSSSTSVKNGGHKNKQKDMNNIIDINIDHNHNHNHNHSHNKKKATRFSTIIIAILSVVIFTKYIPERKIIQSLSKYEYEFEYKEQTKEDEQQQQIFFSIRQVNDEANKETTTTIRQEYQTKNATNTITTITTNTSLGSMPVQEQVQVDKDLEKYGSLLPSKALEFVLGRRQKFKEKDRPWHLYGLGYLYNTHDIILAAVVPSSSSTTSPSSTKDVSFSDSQKNIIRVGEIHSIKIFNVHPAAADSAAKHARILSSSSSSSSSSRMTNWCQDFTLWVRVRGPEMVAGRAKGVISSINNNNTNTNNNTDDNCHWKFDFELNTPGEYHVDAKMLTYGTYNRSLTGEPLNTMLTKKLPKVVNPEDIVKVFPTHFGFKGFKLYYPPQSCMEFCTRMHPYCLYWATPAFRIESPGRADNGCEFFYADDTPDELIPKSHLLPPAETAEAVVGGNRTTEWDITSYKKFSHGRPHTSLPAHNYIGCGWSNWYTLDFPCLSKDLDDKIFMLKNSFTVVDDDDDDSGSGKRNTTSAIVRDGDVIPFRRNNQGSNGVGVSDSSRDHLPLCSIENEIHPKGRWIQYPWPSSAVCPNEMQFDSSHAEKFDITEFDPNNPHCWHRDDLRYIGSTCIEINCRLIDISNYYFSPVKNSSTWYGVWKQDSCEYMEFSNEELQQCVTKRKIRQIESKGVSIASFLNEYLKQRLQFIEFYNGDDDDDEGLNVTIDTLALVHGVHKSDDQIPRIHFNPMKDLSNSTNQEYYFVTSPFSSSEREIYAHVDRIDRLNQMAKKALLPKGYRVLNYFDLSAAFSYDTATQMDGLHIIGPPMKMIITQLFHYTCKDVIG